MPTPIKAASLKSVIEMTVSRTFPGRCACRWVQLLALAALGWLSPPIAGTAWAGRPLFTEDAGVLSEGTCEIESFVSRPQDANLLTRATQLGCGAGGQTQLAIATVSESYSSTSLRALTGKTSLIELSDQSAGLALAYAVLWRKNQHEHFHHQALEARAVLTAPVGHYLIHANAGWIGSKGTAATRDDRLTWNIALERPKAIGAVDLMMELVGDHKTAPCLQLGARWAVVPDRIYLDGAWGIQGNAGKDKHVSVGMKVVF